MMGRGRGRKNQEGARRAGTWLVGVFVSMATHLSALAAKINKLREN